VIVSAERDELLRLVEELPDEQVHRVLTDVRHRLADRRTSSWPPAWFGSVEGTPADTAERADELLAEGFGR
jgi:hypothetical protein